MAVTEKYSILMVDDSSSNLESLSGILKNDYLIFKAKSGALALEIAAKELPDMILLDLIMPGIDGFEVLNKLKEDPYTRKIPVIFITGSENETDEERCFDLGAVDYIKKPFRAELIKARVRAHIGILGQLRASEQLGLTDPMTGLANRRSFDDRIKMEWYRAIRDKNTISFLMMDIDKFKSYNDTYGHPQGDELLKAAAKVFAEKARRPADLSIRLGGEEFGILLPNTSSEAAMVIAEEVRKGVKALRIPTADNKVITTATISIGVISMVPANEDRMEDFIAQSDKNLYEAKEGGRNRICQSTYVH
ncbi:MAG: diguanylate cyclase [Treponema sp.]|nr:diguanylate cyclase [Treponema sp.]